MKNRYGWAGAVLLSCVFTVGTARAGDTVPADTMPAKKADASARPVTPAPVEKQELDKAPGAAEKRPAGDEGRQEFSAKGVRG